MLCYIGLVFETHDLNKPHTLCAQYNVVNNKNISILWIDFAKHYVFIQDKLRAVIHSGGHSSFTEYSDGDRLPNGEYL